MNRMATDLRVPVTRIADIVNEKRGITADTALGFAHYFKNSPTFWMNLQTRYDGQSANGARRINRLRVRLSATAGFVGHCWLALFNVLAHCCGAIRSVPRHFRECPAWALSSSACISSRYCLSYTAVLVILLPFASVPFAVTVRVLPSADRAIRAVVVTLPSFF